MVMRDLCGEEVKVQWDDPAPSGVVEKFKQVISGLSDLRNISIDVMCLPNTDPIMYWPELGVVPLYYNLTVLRFT